MVQFSFVRTKEMLGKLNIFKMKPHVEKKMKQERFGGVQ